MISVGFVLLAAQVHAALTVGDRVAPFNLPQVRGPEYSWSPGRVTVLTFCAFWCDTWKEQLPQVAAAERQLRVLPIDFATISVDGRWTEQGRKAAVGAILCDPGMTWTNTIGIDRVPYTVVIDSSGRVRWAVSGEVSAGTLVNEARRALRADRGGGTIYLTFDDFPAESANDELLDELRRLGVKATIFCICSKATRFPGPLRRAEADGNELEVHAWIHGEAHTDLSRCAQTLRHFGAAPTLFRPSGKQTIFTFAGRPILTPVVNPYDYTRPGGAELIRRITHQVVDGCVIQLHAGVSDTLAMLPDLVGNLRARGFHFRLLSTAPGLAAAPMPNG